MSSPIENTPKTEDYQREHIESLKAEVAQQKLEIQKLQGDYNNMTKEQIEEMNEFDLREMAHYYGGWDKLRDLIEILEEGEAEAAYERSQNEY